MRLRLLGALELEDEHGPIGIPGAGQRRILGLLAIHSPAVVPAGRIAELRNAGSASARPAPR